MDKFWSLSENKVSFQQFFIQWLMSTYSGDDKITFLGGLQVSNAEAEPLLSCSHMRQMIESSILTTNVIKLH